MERQLSVVLVIALALVVAPMTAGGGRARADDLVRLAGETRYETAIAISKLWPSSREVVLVTGEDFPDALSAGPFAASRGAPILLTTSHGLPPDVRVELVRLQPERVWIVGGEQAVSAAVSDAVIAATDAEVRRLAGRDRFATAHAVTRALGPETGTEALIALGSHPESRRAWPDAVSAGAFNATGDLLPLVLVSPAGVPDGTRQVLEQLRIDHLRLVGGTAAIPVSVEQELVSTGRSTERLAGPDRYATSRAVVDEVLERLATRPPVPLIAASGENYPDALVASALAARLSAPLVLVPSSMDDETGAWFRAHRGDFSDVYVIGGDAAVPTDVVDELCDELCDPGPDPNPEPTPAPSTDPDPRPDPDPTPTETAAPDPDPTPTETESPDPDPTPTDTESPDPDPTPGPSDLPVLQPAAVPPGPSTSMHTATAFLYSGPDAVQTGMDPDMIEPLRVAVLRGRVLDTAGDPLPGVEVTVHDRPDFGRTLTRTDGAYDLAVNGGGPVVLDFERDDVLPVQRKVTAPWRDFVVLDDVVMTPLDPVVTVVQADADEPQVARGSVVEDADGPRQASLLFEPGTTAEMVLPDGTRQPLGELSVRATEYTVGDAGPTAMPGELPPSSGYTYAVELSVDEAMAAGATSIEFDRAVPVYVDNFLGFATGERVPLGWYDRDEARWVPADDGAVIEILGESDGLAEVDTTGDGVADGTGLSEVELRTLAELYEPGQRLWRVALDHFTPWDANWPWGPPEDAEPPDPPEEPLDDDGTDDDCEQSGSIIHCQSQSLTERIPLAGVSGGLSYSSRRVGGHLADGRFDVPLVGPDVPSGIESIEVTTSIAGRTWTEVYLPAPGLTHHVEWDGRDAYGRSVSGAHLATVRMSFVYPAVYYSSPGDFRRSFARFGSGAISAGSGGGGGGGGDGSGVAPLRAQQKIRVARTVTRPVGSVTFGGLGADVQHLGGWSLDSHHVYDPLARTLHRGDGVTQTPEPTLTSLTPVIGAVEPVDGDPWPVRMGNLTFGGPIAVGADGSIYLHRREYYSVGQGTRLYRVTPQGVIERVAGCWAESNQPCPQPSPTPHAADDLHLGAIQDIEVGPGGSVYIAVLTDGGRTVSRIGPDGMLEVVAGLGDEPGENLPATDVQLGVIGGLAVSADGTVWVSDRDYDRIRRIGTDGIIQTAVGPPLDDTPWDDGGFAGDGGPATAARIDFPRDIELGDDGTLYIADFYNDRVRAVTPDGTIDTVAGGGPSGAPMEGVAAVDAVLESPGSLAVDENTLFVGSEETTRNRVHAIDASGTIRTVAGGGSSSGVQRPATVSERPAVGVPISYPRLSLRPSGELLVHDRLGDIQELQAALPGVGLAEIAVADTTGREVHVFDPTGRHLRSIDGLTGDLVQTFDYDEAGLLQAMQDREGDRTLIERDAAGTPMAVVAPDGHRTTLGVDERGLLTGVTDPTGVARTMTYGEGALLSSFSLSGAGTSSFSYDEAGLLVADDHPDGGQTTLERSESTDRRTTTVRVTSPAGRVTTYETTRGVGGELTRRVTDPHGQVTLQVRGPDATMTTTFPDGTIEKTELTSDPRFGFQAPVVARHVVTTPGGRSTETTRTVDAEGVDAAGNAERITRSVTHQGRTWTSVWDTTDRALTDTSPEGRTSLRHLDELGRVSSVEPGEGLSPVTISYDEHGRVTSVDHGDGATTYDHDEAGRVVSETDATGATTTYVHDDADRLLEAVAPDEAVYRFGHDGAGRPVTVTTPDGAEHVLDRRADGRVVGWTYPDDGQVSFGLDPDGRLVEAMLPSAATVSHVRDDAGRLDRIDGPETVASFGYDGVLARPASASRDALDGVVQQLAVDRDGPLVTGRTLTGEVEATFSHTFDDRMLVDSVELVSGADTVTIPYVHDDDGLLIGRGPLAFERSGPAGAVGSVSDAENETVTSRTYDARGAVASIEQSVAGTAVYEVTYERDAVGRIVERTETTAGPPTVTAYEYDVRGQLAEVTRDGTVVETYTYDGDGNRTSRQLGAGPVESATFDGEYLLEQDAVDYTFDDDGFLTDRGDDTFDYDRDGALRSATVDGTTVTYATDGLGRRVARRVGGETTEYLYGEPTDPLLVTAVRRPDGGLTILHYDEAGFLAAFGQDEERFAVTTDEVGSPRIVTDSTGTIRERWEYDAFGGVSSVQDDGAIDLPLGFAGGLPDTVTGLVRFGARDHDPVAGRWTARDPLHFHGGQLNLYAYAGNDPVNRRDPAGLSATGKGWQEQLNQAWGSGLEWADQNRRKIAEQVVGLSERGQKWLGRVNFGEKALNSYSRLRDALCSAGGNSAEEAAAWLNEGLEWLKDTPAAWVTPVEAAQQGFNRLLEHRRDEATTGSINYGFHEAYRRSSEDARR